MCSKLRIDAVAVVLLAAAGTATASDRPDAAYADMPHIAPIGVRIAHYLPVPQNAKGPAIDPAKGYRLQEMGKGLYLITDNAYQSMFMV